jgi:hypothetical protein
MPQTPSLETGAPSGEPALFASVNAPSDSWPHLSLAVVLTLLALLIVAIEMRRWLDGGALPLAMLWAPMSAFGAWGTVSLRYGWSPRTQQWLAVAGWTLGVFFAVLLGFATREWLSYGRSSWPAIAAAAYVFLIVIGSLVKRRRDAVAVAGGSPRRDRHP